MKRLGRATQRRTSRPRRKGAAAVEFGLALPVLILIAIGAVDLGRFASNYIAISNSARVGAGFGCMNPTTPATLENWRTLLRQQVIAEMQSNIDHDQDISETDVAVAAELVMESPQTGYRRVDVTVSIPFDTIIDWPGLPAEWTLTRKVSMRVIR